MLDPTLELARQLIKQPSVTPVDGGCQQLISERLAEFGFQSEPMPFGEVTNLWCRRGSSEPLFCFAGHTDVVPTGPEEHWRFPPYSATVVDGELHGRGAADMKGSIAAFVTAVERFVYDHPHHQGSIALLLTSDEEGPAHDGTIKVIQKLQQRGESIKWCLVGEPSSNHRLGDVIKIGRRGSLSGHLTIHGIQGHVAYPHLANNPIHQAADLVKDLTTQQWDEGNEHFPPTSLQISNIHAGTGATNVIPGELVIDFNLRFSTEQSELSLKDRIESLIKLHGLDFSIQWSLSGEPFLTGKGSLLKAASAAIQQIINITPDSNTSGGTSDGRFIAPTGAQVIELGPLNSTIHKIDERVSVQDLLSLSRIYEQILKQLLL